MAWQPRSSMTTHHVVAAVGVAGERAAERGDQGSLQHAEPVVTPTGFAVVVGDAVGQQFVVVGVDECVVDICANVRAAGSSPVK